MSRLDSTAREAALAAAAHAIEGLDPSTIRWNTLAKHFGLVRTYVMAHLRPGYRVSRLAAAKPRRGRASAALGYSKDWRLEGRLTKERLRSLLTYNPELGEFTRNHQQGPCLAGSVAGSPNEHGYVRICIDGCYARAHRLAWFWTYDSWPSVVDHINGNRSDNRIANLREAPGWRNAANKGRSKNNKSGFKGVTLKKKRWQAQIAKDGTSYHLGTFDTPESAHQAYVTAARQLFGEFARS